MKIPVNTKKAKKERKKQAVEFFGTQSLLTKNTTTWHETLHTTTTTKKLATYTRHHKKISNNSYTHIQTLTNCYKFNKMAKILFIHSQTHTHKINAKSICHKMLNGIHNNTQ